MVTIDLSDKEASIFRSLAEANALDIVNGSVLIDFDSEGRPAHVEVRRHTRLSPHGGIDVKIVV